MRHGSNFSPSLNQLQHVITEQKGLYMNEFIKRVGNKISNARLVVYLIVFCKAFNILH